MSEVSNARIKNVAVNTHPRIEPALPAQGTLMFSLGALANPSRQGHWLWVDEILISSLFKDWPLLLGQGAH